MKARLLSLCMIVLTLCLLSASCLAAGDAWQCPVCTRINDGDFAFCTDCGSAHPTFRDCPSCGKRTKNLAFVFCPSCGASLTGQAAPMNDPDQPHDMGVPNLYGRTYSNDRDMNMDIFWVQTQLKALRMFDDDITGSLGLNTPKAVASFMKSRGIPGHSGNIDQQVVNTLKTALGDRLVPVYVGGFYEHMNSIMSGGSAGSMELIINDTDHAISSCRWAQWCLKQLGYYKYKVDGVYANGTSDAVRSFQEQYRFKKTYHVTLGVARRMLEVCHERGFDLSPLDSPGSL